MFYWLTVFVEVPKITFNPVKEINDLLKQSTNLSNPEIKLKKWITHVADGVIALGGRYLVC